MITSYLLSSTLVPRVVHLADEAPVGARRRKTVFLFERLLQLPLDGWCSGIARLSPADDHLRICSPAG